MRDTFVDIPGVGPNKINAAYAYGGAELVRETLKQNFNLDTKYYAKVDFQSFEKIVDSMFPKGVKIDAEKSLNLDGVDIEKGQQVMDGHVLLQYARFRMDEERLWSGSSPTTSYVSCNEPNEKPNDFIKNPRITWEISRLYVDRCAC